MCIFQDKVALDSLRYIPVETITYEVDYPHSDSTFPRTREIAERHMAGLGQTEVDLICRDNAIRVLQLDHLSG
jgi:hypothetical protein